MKQTAKLLKEYTVILVLIAIAAIFTIGNPAFIKPSNMITILRQSSILGILGIGEMCIIIVGGINLALGSYVSIVTVLVALSCVNWGLPWQAGMVMAIVVSTICGLLTGLVTVKARINPMIGTLASSKVLGGIAYIICGGLPIYGVPEASKWIGQGYLGPIPVPVIIFLILAAIFAFILNKTYFGRMLFASGSNDEAARLSGINTTRMRIFAYTLSGLLAGVAGIIMYARVGSGQPAAGADLDMNVLAALVIGGVSMAGGEGKVLKACSGVVLIAMITNGMTLLGFNNYIQMVVCGAIFLGAVCLDSYQHITKRMKPAAAPARASGNTEVKV